MTTHYHQKPIANMTPGEKRAYRRELARAALTGLLPRSTYLNHLSSDIKLAHGIAQMVIEHERREEGGASECP